MDNDKCLILINLYKDHRVLWDHKHRNYHKSAVREDAWKKISSILDEPVDHLKVKMRSLLGTYRREKSRRRQRGGEDPRKKSKWFAFDCFHFLSDRGHSEPTGTSSEEPLELKQEATEDEEVQKNERLLVEEIPGPSSNVTQRKLVDNVSVPSTKIRRNNHVTLNPIVEDSAVMNSFSLPKRCIDINTDSYYTYGQYIANELRKYDPQTLAVVKQAISNIIFDADMGRLLPPDYEYLHHQFDSPVYIQGSAATPMSNSLAMQPSSSQHSSPAPNSFDTESTDDDDV
ncbi:hypothetical protein J437_LFUL008826 [Ladona fulva]|uniref:MADF domain-containing protein n=1 Tax=Ladona fulva TaxID=123851 RepID=A0A8K0KDK3_LADFU|nr:hypothetical protein J437_LFUL008826 [Ladona fulva]